MNHFVLIHKKTEELQKEKPGKSFSRHFFVLQIPDFNSPTVTGIYTTNRKYNFYTNTSIICTLVKVHIRERHRYTRS